MSIETLFGVYLLGVVLIALTFEGRILDVLVDVSRDEETERLLGRE
ncbi:MAG: hypothetical protein ABEJ55_02460 [Halanaeroarchaeum sp.]